jgi:hypothetical protein
MARAFLIAVLLLACSRERAAPSALIEGQSSARYSVSIQTREKASRTLSITLSNRTLGFSYFSESWWQHQFVADDERAALLASQLVSLVWRVGESIRPIPDYFPIPVKRVSATVGSQEVFLGWEANPGGVPPWLWRWWPLHHLGHGQPPLWLHRLWNGDSRARLRVYGDGRADLRISYSLWPLHE